jgi:hypothetical protein
MNETHDKPARHAIPNDEQCSLAERLYEGRNIYLSDACQILADRDREVYGPLLEERDDLREYLNTEIATNSELGDELLAERAAYAEFRNYAWEEQKKLRAERDKLLGFHTEIVKELGDDLVLKRLKDLRAELAAQKVQNNHNWQFQEIAEEAIGRAERAEESLKKLHEEFHLQIQFYLECGGLFNPELMSGAGTRDLLMEIQAALEKKAKEVENEQ